MGSEIKITDLEKSNILQIKRIQPPGWNNVYKLFQLHFGRAYFIAIQAMDGDRLIGVGEVMVLKESAWLGNIIVAKSYRGQGIGQKITSSLIDRLAGAKINQILLLATPLGVPVYKKLGFKTFSNYLFFKRNRNDTFLECNLNIIDSQDKHWDQIFELDKKATGEDRSQVLSFFKENAKVYLSDTKDKIEGFSLPELGDGLVIARNEISGIALLQSRLSEQGKSMVAIPAQNKLAVDYLNGQKYSVYREAELMWLGAMKSWNPDMIFSRIGGYLG